MEQALLLAAALVIGGPRIDAPLPELQKRFEAGCVDGRWQADCPALRSELEVHLYGELRNLAMNGAEFDRDTLRAAARAQFPYLAQFGLRRMAKIGDAADREAALRALEHPSPGVRVAARQLLENQDGRWRTGPGAWWRDSDRNGFPAMVPDVMPEPEELGLPAGKYLEGLRYRYFASDRKRAVFTSRMPADALIASIAPRGAKILDGAKMAEAAQNAAAPSQDAMQAIMASVEKEMQAAMARNDYKALAEISQRLTSRMQQVAPPQQGRGAGPALVQEFASNPLGARYVQLPSRVPGRTITVAAARDEVMGETVLVIQR